MDNMTIKNGGIMTMAGLYKAFLSLQAQRDTASMLRLHNYYNSYLDPEVLDLHFLPAENKGLAIPMLEKRILEIAGGKRPKTELIVVTGRGKRNKNAKSRKIGRIRMEITNLFISIYLGQRIRFRVQQRGRLHDLFL
ncbi:hypothetical protein PENTCL1PPCAC_10332 [Pristionchus entomophagus]|uniref:Smr domain-containing protein n=1 Tax=Pristionchus entomophagus TaxID=358040 RepID=A0AAV5T0U1_9BILA|nr:hypothetical protein PENTCL1PPCAC_10332 [Pristionchus entomophagus]